MQPVQPIHTEHLFPGLHREWMQLLRSLSHDDWSRPTAAGSWKVRDIVAHMLDIDMRGISFRRDKLPPVSPKHPIDEYGDLVRFLDELNAVWVEAFERVSPELLVQLHAITGPQIAEIFAELDPFGPALFGVAWAGEAASENWFDTAREYTERWHHQQQIRDATGAKPLTGRAWLHPVLDTFLRGLPHTYRDVPAPEGTLVAFTISGEAGGNWLLRWEEGNWQLYSGESGTARTSVCMDQDTAWRLLTKGLRREQAAGRVEIGGEQNLGDPVLGMLSIMG